MRLNRHLFWPFCAVLFLAAAQSVSGNLIQDENALPGTASWAISNAATHHEIEGYASLTSVNKGGQVSLFVSTSDANYTIDVFRMGWYGGTGAREVLGPIQLAGTLQVTPTSDPVTGIIECNWVNPYVVTIPSSLFSGIYLAKLTGLSSGKQSYIVFAVRDDTRPSLFLFESCATTYQAYNDWPEGTGGKSLYSSNSSGNIPAVKVSFNRPYTNNNGAGDFLNWEYPMIRFLEREGYDVSYCSDIDLHENSNLFFSHTSFLSGGHDEYWSWNMRANVTAARDQGINLAFFAANACYWQIRLEPSTINGAIDRTLVGYKTNYVNDPYYSDADATNDKYITRLWRDTVGSTPEEELIGVEYITDPVNSDIIV